VSRSNTDPASIVHRAAVALLLGAVLAAVPASGQYGGYFGKNRIQYRDFDWQIYHSPHFDVYHYSAEQHQLQKAVSLAESAYDELSRRFDYQIQEPTPLIIYQTHSAFLQNNIIVYGVPEGAQAFASPVRFRMVLPLDMDDASLLKLIQHELTHIFQYHILFRGRLGAGLRGAPPQWFIEGGASYFADDEDASDRKYMIDMVVNDRIPSVEVEGGGFLAYRFGHAIFDFIEERWGQEAILDLFYEFRNTLGSRVGRAIERTFRMDVEDFDADFRRWARQKYLPELLETGEPGDFGKPFRLEPGRGDAWEMSPAASPSGDLLAAVTTDKQEVDISLFDTQKRRRIKLLTQGLDTQIQWIVAQQATHGRFVGRDLAFSPDGNYLAAFARREEGYALILIDVLNGGLHKIVAMDVEQQLAPAWSPDGRYVAFSGNLKGQFDIFVIDLETLEISNLTNDEVHDAGPAYSPDGRWLAYSAVVGEYHQIFRIDLADPGKRYQLTAGDFHSKEPIYSGDGQRIYFASDRDGRVDNVYGLDLERAEVRQYTNALTGCDQPMVLPLPEGGERLVYTGYWKGQFNLYTTDVEEPVEGPEPAEIASEPAAMAELARFEPDIEVAIDEDNIEGYGGRKFFIEDIQNFVGLDSNNVFRGQVIVTLSDYLGDRRIVGVIAADDIFSDFDIAYYNLRNRWQWSARLFQQKIITYAPDFEDMRFERRTAFSITGAEYARIYPFNRKNRFEVTGGYYYRDYRFTFTAADVDGNPVTVISPRTDAYPTISAAIVSDSTIFNQWGPLNGHRVRLSSTYAPDFDESGTLFTDVTLDARKYVAAGRRANLAFRFVGFTSDGNFPNVRFVGGLDTVRGYEFRQFAGFRGFYGNAELRFPLIDQLRFPGFALNGIRGVVFFDVGSAWFPEVTDFELYEDDRLQNAVAAFGFGVTVNFLGLPLNWDFARLTNLDESASSFETSFWIGARF